MVHMATKEVDDRCLWVATAGDVVLYERSTADDVALGLVLLLWRIYTRAYGKE